MKPGMSRGTVAVLFTVLFDALAVHRPCAAGAQVLPVMEEVVTTARGSGRFLDAPGTTTTVFTAEDIARMQVRSLPDLIESLASVRAVEHGTPGSQADLSIRGSSSEGVLVMVDGIPVRDPQTGHFIMDLPVRFSGVERVEVLTGGGSTLYGASATGGIVNIVTREGSDRGISLSAGSFGTIRGEGSFSFGGERRSAAFGVSMTRSDGYREGSDLKAISLDGSGRWRADQWDVRWSGGMLKKEFGARDFYVSKPDTNRSFERTMTVHGGIHALRMIGDRSLVRLRAGVRGHADDYILKRDNPSFYRNTHYNRGFLLGMEYASRLVRGGSLTLGAEGERIGITSGRLGGHADLNVALYGDYSGTVGRGAYGFTLRYDRGYRGEHIVSPGLGIVYPVAGAWRARARLERSFRSPTYTERFYSDKSNSGNPDLCSERSVSVEAGIDRKVPGLSVKTGMFAVRTSEVIDWVRNHPEEMWSAANHGLILTYGAEAGAAVSLVRGWRLSTSGVGMIRDVRRRAGAESKYALNAPERTVSAIFDGPLVSRIACSVGIRYERMRSGDARVPLSLRLSRRYGSVEARLSADNIGNERYEELPYLPVPGRRFAFDLEFGR